jgi:hypothetical protein
MDGYLSTHEGEVNIEKLANFFAILKRLKNSPKKLEKLVEYKLERRAFHLFFGLKKIVGIFFLAPTPFFAKEVGRDGVGLYR